MTESQLCDEKERGGGGLVTAGKLPSKSHTSHTSIHIATAQHVSRIRRNVLFINLNLKGERLGSVTLTSTSIILTRGL